MRRVLPLALVLSACGADLPRVPTDSLGVDLEGEVVRIDPARTTVVVFWASWCGLCKRYLREIGHWRAEHDFDFVAVNAEDAPEDLARMQARQPLAARVAHDEGQVSAAFEAGNVPMVFVLGYGAIHCREVGYSDRNLERIRGAIRQLEVRHALH